MSLQHHKLHQLKEKFRDIVDFIKAYTDNRDRIDRTLLADLASRAHENAREEFPRFLKSVEKGRPIIL